MNNKLLVVCGPTATGKTQLAFDLAKRFGGELLSVDSRQVYQGMDIGTGKDIPDSAEKITIDGKVVYEVEGIKLWGLDIVSPKEDFSVSHYQTYAQEVIEKMEKDGKLPILVGGSGLYIQAVVEGISTANIPPNLALREKLRNYSVEKLYEKLENLNKQKAFQLNESDRKNPRRLVRAIEIEMSNLHLDAKISVHDTLFIGLTLSRELLNEKISKRVEERVTQGIVEEISTLLDKGVDWGDKAMDTMGYKEWKGYFEKQQDIKEVKSQWSKDEHNYAKKQLTWFKKIENIHWFDISTHNWLPNVVKLVESWIN